MGTAVAERPGAARPLPLVAWSVVLGAALAQAVVLTLGSVGYGYHRDELYFRMLPPSWGYVDQPPLTPLLARLSAQLGDHPWVLRVPATAAAAGSVVVVALIARRLGGGRGAQMLCAWGYAFGAMPLMMGHLLVTSTIDLLLLALVVLLVLRAVDEPRWWLAAAAAAGCATYNRLLVVVLAAGLVLGLLVLGPRAPLRSRWFWLGGLLAAVLAAPAVAYQATHDWPQLAMGAALGENNADDVRIVFLPLLLLMLGPPLVVVWAVGVGWLLRGERRGRHGFLVVAFAVMLVFTFVGGAQPHYPIHLLAVMYAAGCVPVAQWLRGRNAWRVVAVGLVALNAAVSCLLALPVISVGRVGDTPIAGVSPLVGDQVGWPAYADQMAAAYDQAGGAGAGVQVITSNYGEAGAVARFGPRLGLPLAFSGHNSLHDLARPPDGTEVVVLVGGQFGSVEREFASCDIVDRLDNGVGVDNEEQGQPVAICRRPLQPWAVLWPHFKHLD